MFGLVENVITSIINYWPTLRTRKYLVTIPVCIFGYILGLSMMFGNGVNMLTLLDWACGGWTLLIFGLAEVVVVGWAYGLFNFIKNGTDRLMDNWDEMKNWVPYPLKLFWMACLYVISPIMLVVFLIMKIAKLEPVGGKKTPDPPFVQTMAACTVLFTILMIPVGIVYRIIYRKIKGMSIRFADLISPTDNWGPKNVAEEIAM